MTGHSYHELRRLFDQLSQLGPERQRAKLDEVCVGKPELRTELESLLDHAVGKTEDLLAGPRDVTVDTGAGGAGFDGPSSDPAILDGLRQVGRYQIVRRIGEGGMGVVYEAKQDSPSRRVALKLLAPFSGPEAERRFELEGELLGRLQHPGIARVYDAGTATTDHGTRAYLAMELVDGSELLEHANRLPMRERLMLVAEIADAVEHAHQRGVIHRDLKPANVLVEKSGRPMVLDFGIARALDADAEQITRMTQAGMIVGTLSYMSPEQASGDPAQIDTRTDVYALGVIAYEVLSGQLPIELGFLSITSALDAVRQRSPTPLRNAMEGAPGDVETIVHCALQKDPDQRYRSAGAMADDLRRFLERRPITARPPSAIYELRQFVRRHRLPVALVVVAIISVTVGFFRARAAESTAEKRRIAAESALADAEAVSAFLANLVDEANPINTDGDELTFREALDQAALTMEEQLGDRPLVLATVHEVFGQDYDFVGELESAERHLRRAFTIRHEELGLLHRDTIESAGALALFLTRDGYDDESALAFLSKVLPEMEAGAADHSAEMSTLYLAHGTVLMRNGELGLAKREMSRALDTQPLESGSRRAPLIFGGMAAVLSKEGRKEEAEVWLRRALENIERSHGTDSHQASTIQSNLAANLKQQGRLVEAESLFLASLEIRQRLHGEGSPVNLPVEANYAGLLVSLARYEEAETLLARCVDAHRGYFGVDHANVGFPLYQLGMARAALGNHETSLESFSEVVELWEKAMGPEHRNLIRILRGVGDQLGHLGRWSEAESRYRRGAEIAAGIDGYEREHQWCRAKVASCLMRLGDEDGARELAMSAWNTIPKDLALSLLVGVIAAEAARESGDLSTAESMLRQVVTTSRSDAVAQRRDLSDLQAEAHFHLTEVLVANGELEEAQDLLEEYRPVAKERLGEEHWRYGHLESMSQRLRSLSNEEH